MAGRREGGSQNERGKEKRGREKERPARTLLFSLFFRPPEERKNPDWSDLMKYLIHPSDWSATCHSKPQRSSHIYIQQIKRSFRTNSRGNATIFGRKWYQIRAKSQAKEGVWTVLRKTDLLAVLPTGYGKSFIYQLLICFLADGLNIFPQAFIATDWQELHASPHLEHIPILSYPYISIYRTSWPYMDMWASMKFWP